MQKVYTSPSSTVRLSDPDVIQQQSADCRVQNANNNSLSLSVTSENWKLGAPTGE